MKKLSEFLIEELNLSISDGQTPSSVRFDLAVLKSMVGDSKMKEDEDVEEEDFSLNMAENTEPEIRKKMREYYQQLGYTIKTDGIMKEDYSDFSVKLKNGNTLSVTATVCSKNLMLVTVNIWRF